MGSRLAAAAAAAARLFGVLMAEVMSQCTQLASAGPVYASV